MRTTLTLDDDLAEQLNRLAKATGRSFKQVVNEVLRDGLNPPEPLTADAVYPLPKADLQLRPGVDLTHALRAVAAMEDDEAARRLELRK